MDEEDRGRDGGETGGRQVEERRNREETQEEHRRNTGAVEPTKLRPDLQNKTGYL